MKVMEQAEIDPVADQVDDLLAGVSVGDLSDGGRVRTGGVSAKIIPMSGWGGKKTEKGRPAARRAWMMDGTESMLPLGWNPEGTQHDGARKYLLKRHCLCCHTAGFRGQQCPNCVKNGCDACQGSTDAKKIIPCFYLRKEDVPFPTKFYGSVDCFLPTCPRRGGKGFKTNMAMRIHARFRHRVEYQEHMNEQQAAKADEVTSLREQVNALLGAQLKAAGTATVERPLVGNGEEVASLRKQVESLLAEKQANRSRMAKARAGRKKKTVATI